MKLRALLQRPEPTGLVLGVCVPLLLLTLWFVLDELGLAALRDFFYSTIMLLLWPTSIMLMGGCGHWSFVIIPIALNIPFYVMAVDVVAIIVRRKSAVHGKDDR